MSLVPAAETRKYAILCSIILYSHASHVVSTEAFWNRNICGNYGKPFCIHLPSTACKILPFFSKGARYATSNSWKGMGYCAFFRWKIPFEVKRQSFLHLFISFSHCECKMRREWEKWGCWFTKMLSLLFEKLSNF